jgi:glycerol-3-phosphate dehydrogenase (NAD(P)+)
MTTVLGAGSWGTALAILLAKNGQPVKLWSHQPAHIQQMQRARCNENYLPNIPFPDNLQVIGDLPQAMHEAQDVLIVVPSQAFEEVLQRMQPFYRSPTRVAWGTKGLTKHSQLLHAQAQKLLGEQVATAVISGPSFAIEVALEKPTAVTVASTDAEFAQALSTHLNNHYFRVYLTTDIIGVEICGVVKNVLAIAAGIIDALALGANALSAFITRGLAELQRLGIAMGGQAATFMGLAGVGDLVLTCTANLSRNRRFGAALVAGLTADQAIQSMGVVEGLENLKNVYQLAQQYQVEMPIIEQIYQVIYQGLSVQIAVQNLFARQPRRE